MRKLATVPDAVVSRRPASPEVTDGNETQVTLEYVREKQESQEICFVPDGDHAALIRRLADILDADEEDLPRRMVEE